jgi:hypothetical protein
MNGEYGVTEKTSPSPSDHGSGPCIEACRGSRKLVKSGLSLV